MYIKIHFNHILYIKLTGKILSLGLLLKTQWNNGFSKLINIL